MAKQKRKAPTATKAVDTSKGGADRPGDEAPWSKSKKKRMRLLLAKQRKKDIANGGGDGEQVGQKETNKQMAPSPLHPKASKLQQGFRDRLSGSRFRILNEELYTTTSQESFERFAKHPELFQQYHEGFRYQVDKHWPSNPVDVIVNSLIHFQKKKSDGNSENKFVVADFGCGDANLAKQLLDYKDRQGVCPFTVHSFDLVAPTDHENSHLITACDMANVPLEDGVVDAGIFCLSLMGTNLADFIREAHRVLKPNGILKIAEVRSRFESSHDKKVDHKNQRGSAVNRELQDFLKVLNQLGFETSRKPDQSNKMFVLLDLRKIKNKTPRKDVSFTAKPCIYKRR